ncbi:hypothetical protein [Hansschlegelia sp. KR7-227]|uniref:hypothetical protein n=1 Tax=Hansschlegelia sp. KR7-227 TaxID=3400914 RepID=UPI003C013802
MTETEAVILATANNRIADLERHADHSIATLRVHLSNERAAKRSALTVLQQSEIRVRQLEAYIADLEAIIREG